MLLGFLGAHSPPSRQQELHTKLYLSFFQHCQSTDSSWFQNVHKQLDFQGSEVKCEQLKPPGNDKTTFKHSSTFTRKIQTCSDNFSSLPTDGSIKPKIHRSPCRLNTLGLVSNSFPALAVGRFHKGFTGSDLILFSVRGVDDQILELVNTRQMSAVKLHAQPLWSEFFRGMWKMLGIKPKAFPLNYIPTLSVSPSVYPRSH